MKLICEEKKRAHNKQKSINLKNKKIIGKKLRKFVVRLEFIMCMLYIFFLLLLLLFVFGGATRKQNEISITENEKSFI